MTMVVDTSAILAVIFNEAKGSSIAKIMQQHATELRMSTVTLAESLILLQDRQPQLFDGLRLLLLGSNIRFVAHDPAQAVLASEARIKFPINLGDCFAYALAKTEDCALLTLDKDFGKTDIPLVKIG